MAIEEFEGVSNLVKIISTFLGGIVGIYLLSVIMKWIYDTRVLKTLKEIKMELQALNSRLSKNESRSKKRSS